MRSAVKITCDVKSALLTLDRMGIEARGFDHDVMLYAFLLDADPSGCPLDEQARRRLDLQARPLARAARRYHARDLAAARARRRRARPARALRHDRAAAGRACWRAWSAPASASTRSS